MFFNQDHNIFKPYPILVHSWYFLSNIWTWHLITKSFKAQDVYSSNHIGGNTADNLVSM